MKHEVHVTMFMTQNHLNRNKALYSKWEMSCNHETSNSGLA